MALYCSIRITIPFDLLISLLDIKTINASRPPHAESKQSRKLVIITITIHLHRPRNAQLPNLAQNVLHPRVEIATGILIARRSIEVLLHLRHAAVGFRAEA